MVFEFWKSTLSVVQQKVYNDILSCINRGANSYETDLVDGQGLYKVYEAIYFDHVELFQLPHNPTILAKKTSIKTFSILELNYIYNISEVFTFRRKIDKVIKYFINEKVKSNKIYEIEKKICDYFLENVTYEINNLYNQNMGNVLCNNIGQCSGIAKAVKYICDCLNIKCIFVIGEIKPHKDTTHTIAHAWNIIEIEGAYYHLDVTNMIGANVNRNKPFNYKYLNYSDAMMKNYIWDNTFTPKCYNSKNDVFDNLNGIKSILSLYELKIAFKEHLNSKGNKFIFKSKIKCDDSEELMKLIYSSCSSVTNAINMNVEIRIIVSGMIVTLDCRYK